MRHDARTPCGSRVRMRMQQSRAHSSEGVKEVSVRCICVAVRDHSCSHASWSNEMHRKLRYIKFNNHRSRKLFSSIFTEQNFGFHTKNSWIYQHRKQSVRVMRSMMHARVRINPHGWTQVTQLRVTLPRICLTRHGSHACFQNARFQKIYIFILILILSEKMMRK